LSFGQRLMSPWLKSECLFVHSPYGLILLRALV
jgi:hypothetical protein